MNIIDKFQDNIDSWEPSDTIDLMKLGNYNKSLINNIEGFVTKEQQSAKQDLLNEM